MKKKAMIMAVASLGSMALIGTGFAGWVISANAEWTANGVVTAYDVQDQRLKIGDKKWAKKATDEKSGKIVYGKPAGTASGSKWFDFVGVDDECLANNYTFTVASGDANDKGGKFNVSAELAIADTKKDAWNAAVTDKIVAAPTAVVTTPTEQMVLDGQTSVPVAIAVNFNWGDHFKVGEVVKNPYVFYNEKEVGAKIDDTEGQTKTWGDDAAEFMHKFSTIQEVGFTLKITVTRADA